MGIMFPATPEEVTAARRAGINPEGLSGPELRRRLEAVRSARKEFMAPDIAREYQSLFRQCRVWGLHTPIGIKLPSLMNLYGRELRCRLVKRGIVEGARIRMPCGVLTKHGRATVGELHTTRLPATLTLKFDKAEHPYGFAARLVLQHARLLR